MHGEAELKKFMEGLNNFLPNLFTYESSKKRVAFLDLNISLENGSVTTDLHTKRTNSNQYLHSSSSHPDHIKNSIIYSQTLRLSNICKYEEDFDKYVLNMKSWFLERGYSKQIIDSQMRKVKFGQRLVAGNKQAGFGVPFVLTYHPKLKKFIKIMKKLEHLLYHDESVKGVFTPPPVVSYRSARKLSSYLVRAKEKMLLEKPLWQFEETDNIEETNTFTSTVTGDSFKINHHLCYNDKCLINVLT